MTKQPKKLPNRFSRKMILAAILFWGALFIFLKLAGEVREHEPILLDTIILNWARGLQAEGLTKLVRLLTNGGSALFIFIFSFILAGLLWFHKRKRDAVATLIAVGGAGVANFLLKLLFQRARPTLWPALVHENSFSFPSGHAMGSAALGFAVILMLWNTRWRWFGLIMGVLYIGTVGFTRVYLGVHYPSDIVAGWSISFIWVLLVYILVGHPTVAKNTFIRSLKSLKLTREIC